ncbi:hypothetical protein BG004_001616 [Podila humilis]|nr:hypothetical protein BG004_001616 [Podila humilis]
MAAWHAAMIPPLVDLETHTTKAADDATMVRTTRTSTPSSSSSSSSTTAAETSGRTTRRTKVTLEILHAVMITPGPTAKAATATATTTTNTNTQQQKLSTTQKSTRSELKRVFSSSLPSSSSSSSQLATTMMSRTSGRRTRSSRIEQEKEEEEEEEVLEETKKEHDEEMEQVIEALEIQSFASKKKAISKVQLPPSSTTAARAKTRLTKKNETVIVKEDSEHNDAIQVAAAAGVSSISAKGKKQEDDNNNNNNNIKTTTSNDTKRSYEKNEVDLEVPLTGSELRQQNNTRGRKRKNIISISKKNVVASQDGDTEKQVEMKKRTEHGGLEEGKEEEEDEDEDDDDDDDDEEEEKYDKKTESDDDYGVSTKRQRQGDKSVKDVLHPSKVVKAAMSEYERERLENIRKNQQMLEFLQLPSIATTAQLAMIENTPIPITAGLLDSSSTCRGAKRMPKQNRIKKPPVNIRPSRISSRLRGLESARMDNDGDGDDDDDDDREVDNNEEENIDNLMPGDLFFDKTTRDQALRVDGHYTGWVHPDVRKRHGIAPTAKEAWASKGGGRFSFKNPLGDNEEELEEVKNEEEEEEKEVGGGSSLAGNHHHHRSIPKSKKSKTDARMVAKALFKKNPNAYFYRHTEPGVEQWTGDWTSEEHELFLKVARDHGCGDKWGLFASHIPHRVGYQCSNYYRQVIIPEGLVFDPNYYYTSRGRAVYRGKHNSRE